MKFFLSLFKKLRLLIVFLLFSTFSIASENNFLEQSTLLQHKELKINSEDLSNHLDELIENHEAKINRKAAGASLLGLSVFPVFGKLSANCGGFSNYIPVLDTLAGELICGVGGGLAISGIFMVTLYNIHELASPVVGPNKQFYTINFSQKLKQFSIDALYFGIGWTACIPMFYLNMTQTEKISSVLPESAMIIWSEITQITGGLSYIWPSHELVHGRLQPFIQKQICHTESLISEQKTILKKALISYGKSISEMSNNDVDTLYNSLYSQASKQKNAWKNLFSTATESLLNKKSISYSKAAICLGASAIAIFAGYANWPLSVESVESFASSVGLPNGLLAEITGQIVGATGFFVLGSLMGISTFESFQQLFDAFYKSPLFLLNFPKELAHYLTHWGSFKEKLSPIAKTALVGAAFYETICAPMNLMTITTMETSGWWHTFLQGCVIVGNATTSWFCFNKIADGIYNRFFALETEKKRHRLISLMKDLTHHIDYMNNDAILAIQEMMTNKASSVN